MAGITNLLKKAFMVGILIFFSQMVNAEQVCCPSGTVAYCGECCSHACDSEGKCPDCPDGGKEVVDERYVNGEWIDETMCCPSTDYIGLNGVCCLSSKRAAISATERVCCGDGEYSISYSYFVRTGLYRTYHD